MVDLWLYDYKETDARLHLKYTGVPQTPILNNLQRLHDAGAKIVLRCPMIPQHNAREEHLNGIVALARRLPKLAAVELLPYYDLWRENWSASASPNGYPDRSSRPTGPRCSHGRIICAGKECTWSARTCRSCGIPPISRNDGRPTNLRPSPPQLRSETS